MAVALDSNGTMGRSGVISGSTGYSYTGLTIGPSLSNGALVVLILFAESSISAEAVVWDNGGTNQSMTLIGVANAPTNPGRAELWGLVAPTSGNKTLKVTWSGNSSEAYVCGVSWTGVNQTGGATSFPNFNSASTTSAGPDSVTITSATGHAVMAGFAANNGNFNAINNTQLFPADNTGPSINAWGNRAAGASTVAMTVTTDGTPAVAWVAVGCDIAAAAGGATVIYVQPAFDAMPRSPLLPSAQQLWAAFEPKGTIISTTPQGQARTFFDSGLPPRTAANQAWAAFQPRGTISVTTPIPRGFADFFDVNPYTSPYFPSSTQYAASLQQWSDFVPRGIIVSTTPQGWSKFYDSGQTPASAARQMWAAFEPLGAVTASAALGPWGWPTFFDASKIRAVGNGEPTLPPPLGMLPFCAIGFDATDMSWIRLENPGKSPFSALGIKPIPQAAVVTWVATRFFDGAGPPAFAASMRWEAFEPRGTVVSLTPQGGWARFYDSGPAPATAAAQPWSAMAPYQPPLPTGTPGPLGWARFFDAGPRPPTAALQQWAAYPIRFVVTVTPQGFANFFDWGPAAPSAARQPFAAFQPRGNVPLPPQPNGWSTFYDSGRAPASAARQPWAAFAPRGTVVSVMPQGWPRFFDPGIAPPSAARQSWAAFQPRGAVAPPPLPNGWTAFFDAGQAPSTAARQPWSFLQPQGRVISITPQGFGNFFDAGPPPATAARQPWDAWPTEFIIPPPNTGTWGFALFFDGWPLLPPSAPQQFDAWPPQLILPPAPPPITQIGCVIMGRACDCGEPHRRLTFYPGATWEIQGNLHYADGTPFNLGPGCQIFWAMGDPATGIRVVSLSLGNGITVLNAAAGTCLLLIPKAVSLTVPLGSYVDQLRAIDSTGYVSDQWTGPIVVAESFFN